MNQNNVFLIVVSMTGCFAVEFADGTPHFRVMLAHASTSKILGIVK